MKKFLPFQSLVLLSTSCLVGQLVAAQPTDPPAFRPDFSKPGRPGLMVDRTNFPNGRPDLTGKGPNSYLPPRVKTRPDTATTSKPSKSPVVLVAIGLAVVTAGAAFALSKKTAKYSA